MNLRPLARRVLMLSPYHRFRDLEKRVEALENPRFVAIRALGEYLVGAQIPGDYCEFGVFEGRTFARAARYWPREPKLSHMRFFAFDSFQGLPDPKGIDAKDGYTSNFHKGEFACSKERMLRNVRRQGVDMKRVAAVEGWFDQTLTDATAKSLNLDKIAVAWIDGDLYESTVPILKFLTNRLSVGSVIVFDDWKVYRNLPDYGEQRACREWLQANPHISLRELISFGSYGQVFTVSSC